MWLFAQDLCREYNIPTGSYEVFRDPELAKRYIQQQGAPIVVKAVGLAAGKGVVVAHTVPEACAAVEEMLVEQKFGSAGVRCLMLRPAMAARGQMRSCSCLGAVRASRLMTLPDVRSIPAMICG